MKEIKRHQGLPSEAFYVICQHTPTLYEDIKFKKIKRKLASLKKKISEAKLFDSLVSLRAFQSTEHHAFSSPAAISRCFSEAIVKAPAVLRGW